MELLSIYCTDGERDEDNCSLNTLICTALGILNIFFGDDNFESTSEGRELECGLWPLHRKGSPLRKSRRIFQNLSYDMPSDFGAVSCLGFRAYTQASLSVQVPKYWGLQIPDTYNMNIWNPNRIIWALGPLEPR